jgi:hypothetical protein
MIENKIVEMNFKSKGKIFIKSKSYENFEKEP